MVCAHVSLQTWTFDRRIYCVVESGEASVTPVAPEESLVTWQPLTGARVVVEAGRAHQANSALLSCIPSAASAAFFTNGSRSYTLATGRRRNVQATESACAKETTGATETKYLVQSASAAQLYHMRKNEETNALLRLGSTACAKTKYYYVHDTETQTRLLCVRIHGFGAGMAENPQRTHSEANMSVTR
ncbi:unnamed protein product [Rangifer tarandus platyrhynchus]|uniref:Uncharacterized protein n=1 Tax=Rangifer tarandus platyrhynchus TaxID=3082113 RepID=A0ABN8XJ03_RANTA|nr:unnamed protein product [Rangifer tarandus platyrhynchus]